MTISSDYCKQSNAWSRITRGYNFDPYKYQRKSIQLYFIKIQEYGKYFGYLMIISYFTILPKIFIYALPWMIEHLPNKIIPFIGIAFLNTFIQIVYNLVMYFIYKIKHPFFQQYRINKQKPWPWEENYQQWIKLLNKSVKCILINNFLIGAPLACFDSYTSNYTYSIQQIPSFTTIIWQFVIFLLVQDLTLYLGHSTMHIPQFYWIHKQHHEYHTTVSIASQYASPIQSIIVNIPSILGIKLVSLFYPVHAVSMWVFIAFRVVQSSDAHTGYEFSWAQSELLPYSAGSSYHEFHHTKNIGNFASFFKFWDTLFGTNIEYIKYKEKENKIQSNTKIE